MELKIFDQFLKIDAFDWNTLVVQNETDVPFLRYEYLKSWWEFKGGGEWTGNSRLVLVAGFSESQLVAIAPLFIPADNEINKLMLLGSIEISDYLDLICIPQHKSRFISDLLELVIKDIPEVDILDFVNVPRASTTLELLETHASKAGWKIEIQPAYHTPAIQLAADWETYLAGIDKKQRHEIRRKMRRAEDNPDPIHWYMVEDREKLDNEIQALYSLMEMDPDKNKFLTPQMRDQMSEIIHWAFDEGILQLSFLQIDQSKAAAYLSFDYGKHVLVYNSGFDHQFSEYSPGWVLLSYLIQHAVETGKSHFDFMRGDETYKYRFGADDGFVMRALLTRA
ncbi:MAG: GNAT family N-acetyltransferase [Chloroflexi bacterium]|nr:GNAT family N-acetyltransferase [Chloroflexota bacterium]